MQYTDVHQAFRQTWLSGAVGTLYEGLLWLIAGYLSQAYSPSTGIVFMMIAAMGVVPAMFIAHRLLRLPARTPDTKKLEALMTQVAFMIPFCYPVIFAATLHNVHWFYPAMMVVVGAHYWPFVYAYGRRSFAVLGVVLVLLGYAVGRYYAHSMSVGAYLTGCILLLYGVYLWLSTVAERQRLLAQAAA